MTVRVGINGLGRIGRDVLRYTLEHDEIEIVAINDVTDAATIAGLLRQDSTFGPLWREVADLGGHLAVDGRKIAIHGERDPHNIPWIDHGVDVVIESTGTHRARAAALAHLDNGARKVVVSAPGNSVDATIVMGVNESSYDPARHHIVSNASCTTHCVAPMVKVLHDAFGIERAYLTTVHAVTNDQDVLEGPHSDPRRARASTVNIIATTTRATRAIGEVIPAMAGRLDGIALRVAAADASLVDLTAVLSRDADVEAINDAFRAAADAGPLAHRLRYSTEPLVSSDVIGDPSSCVFDAPLTQAGPGLVRVVGWYDNEWGYATRLVELTALVGRP